ncbi:TonB-dependent siderophore receptor, partial [Phenylobacterium aquaticum]|uniref:TonB-dependent receptor plug domain-containing protein n=3 Tax=Phenylobacterium aquaticum TaxID=1763816 RepID=UPI0026EAFE79
DEILRRIPANRVDHIEVIRGGAPGIDMQGKSILANVVRTKTSGLQIVTALVNDTVLHDGRNGWGGRLEMSDHIGPGAFESALRINQYSDDGVGYGPHRLTTPAGVRLQTSDVDSHAGGYQWVVTSAYELPVMGGALRINGRIFEDYYRSNELNWFKAPSRYLQSDNDTQDDRQTEAGARYSRKLGDRLNLELIGLRQTEDLNYISEFRPVGEIDRFQLIKQTEETIGRGVLKYRATDKLSFEVGGENALNILDSTTRFAANNVPIALPAANVHVEENRSEAFTKAVWRPLPQWTIEGGLRYESSEVTSTGDVTLDKRLHFAKPRLFITWAPREGTQIRARYERTVSQLDFSDFVASSSLNTGVVTTGNPDLNPEQAWVSELAVEQRFWRDGSVGLTFTHSELTDVIDRAPVFTKTSVYDAPANIGDGTKDELKLSLTLPLQKLGVPGGRLQGESTWRKSAVTDPTTHQSREISGLKPQAWEGHFSQDLPQWKTTWGVDAYGAWRKTYYRFNEVQTDKLKTYVTLFAEWKPQPDTALRIELNNITSRGFHHILTDYAGPRGSNPITTIDDRDIGFGPMIHIRLRKTFG